jgi:cyclase
MSAFKRLIGCLFLKGGRVVQSIGFRRYLPVGRPEIAARYLDSWGIDELALIDLDARREGRLIDLDIVKRVSDNVFVPLMVGGGIASTADIRSLLSVGADKIVANRAFFDDRKLVRGAAEMFGNQCVVASVDARRSAASGYEVILDSATAGTGVTPWDLARALEQAGAGEILLNAVDRDGARTGYDLELGRRVVAATSLPVIGLGGAGHPAHVCAALEVYAAAAAANFWHYTEHSVAVAKAFAAHRQAPVRCGAAITYGEFASLLDGRLAKLSAGTLEERVFEPLDEDAI